MITHIPAWTAGGSHRLPSMLEQIRNGGTSTEAPSAWAGVRILSRHGRVLAAAAALGIVAGAIATAILPRVYQSEASIQVQGVNENYLSLRDIYPTASPTADNAIYVQTQAEILKQDALVEQVVRKLNLDTRPEFSGGSNSRNEVTSGMTPSHPDIWRVMERVKGALQIVPVRGSSIIRIVCDARTPKLAADIANTLAQTFIDQVVAARQETAKQTQAALAVELADVRRSILASQAELNAYGGGLFGSKSRPDAAGTDTTRRQLDVNRQFYEALSRRMDEARLAVGLAQPNVRLVGLAQPAARPYKPNLLLNLLAGALGCLLLAVACIMFREQTQAVLRTPGEAAACLMIPELGAIPNVNGSFFGLSGIRSGAFTRPQIELASLEQGSSQVSESFRATLASILASGHNGNQPRVLLITSSRPMEGKTTVVSNLGIGLADIGRKVLLIDGDLRAPKLHKVFGQVNSWGFSDLLRERNGVEELPLDSLVKKTVAPHLFLLTGGTPAGNIFGLLWSDRMSRLFPRFRQEFDYILVDTPPCLEFADARILGRHADRAVFVLKADSTDTATAQAALQRLSLDGIHVAGVILNRCRSSNTGQYGARHLRQDIA